jgi:hypothetical protein
MWTESEGRRQNEECRIGENLDSGIRDRRLGCRALCQLRRDHEIRQILESPWEVTARREPRPTGRARLLLSPIQAPVAVSLGEPTWAENVGGRLAVGTFRCKIKFLTVRSLISGWAVTACDFHDALLERRTGGIYRPAIRAKQRLDRRKWSQRRACSDSGL